MVTVISINLLTYDNSDTTIGHGTKIRKWPTYRTWKNGHQKPKKLQ